MIDGPLREARNFHRIDDRLATAGQPTADQIAAASVAGIQVIVNLALATSTGALPDEAAAVSGLGMEYVWIPIDFEQPDLPSALRLFDVLDENRRHSVLVHCAANYRASALVYAYHVARQGMAPEAGRPDLHRFWTPNETWARYVDEAIAAGRREPK